MRWRGGRESENVEDRRDEGGSPFGFPGGGVSFPSGGGSGRSGGIGIVGILIILALMWFFGIDPTVLMQGGGPGGDEGNFPDIHLPQSHPGPDTTNFPAPSIPQGPPLEHPKTTSEDDLRQFVGVVLADTEDVWQDIFRQYGDTYSDPKLVLYSGSIRSACGTGMSAMGPFYCPNDEKVYIDLDFYQELKNRFKAPGDFAQAYVIAHEIGHHVQKLLGIMDQVEAVRQRMSETQGNALQVRVELQADCFAGIFANHAQQSKNIIEPGDIDDALNAASAIGDDKIQKQTQGYVVPDAFTHGSSAQRQRWFKRGYESGKLESCDTFNTDQL